jgi:hypothetical protein
MILTAKQAKGYLEGFLALASSTQVNDSGSEHSTGEKPLNGLNSGFIEKIRVWQFERTVVVCLKEILKASLNDWLWWVGRMNDWASGPNLGKGLGIGLSVLEMY